MTVLPNSSSTWRTVLGPRRHRERGQSPTGVLAVAALNPLHPALQVLLHGQALVAALLAPVVEGNETLSDEAIVDSMMVTMCLEAVRCLEDGIAASATDVDLALIYGIGFPPFRGGALHYIDDFGIDKFVARADELAAAVGPLKAMYLPTEKLREMAASGDAFFG